MGLQNLSSDIKHEKDVKEAIKPDSYITKKAKRIFGALGDFKTMFIQGFKMGFIVGSIFGGLTGLYYAIQYRTIYYIPMIAITSGGSFGFFMGIGMVMRAEMEPKACNDNDESDI